MSEKADNVKFAAELLEQYIKDSNGIRGMLDNMDFDAEKFEEIVSEDWYIKKNVDFGGKSPEEAVREHYNGEADFDAMWEIYETFVKNCPETVPASISKAFAAFGDSAAGVVARLLLEEKDALALDNSKAMTPEEVKKEEGLVSIIESTEYFVHDDVRDSLWDLFLLTPETNELFVEIIAEALVNGYGPWTMVEPLNRAKSIGEKELTLMQAIASSGEHDEMLYKILRKSAKACTPDKKVLGMAIFTDYGDQRAVSTLRTFAKEMREMIVGFDKTYTTEDFRTILSMINKLGGNWEDLQ